MASETGADAGGASEGGEPGDARPPTAAGLRRAGPLPNLFTAPPDVVPGAALVAGAGRDTPVGSLAGLAVASTLPRIAVGDVVIAPGIDLSATRRHPREAVDEARE